MSNNGFPNFPKKGDKVKFTQSWSFRSDRSGLLTVSSGQIGEILDTAVIDGQSYDTAEGYLLYIGIEVSSQMHILKFPYSDRKDVVEVMPNTPAAQVLFGRR